MNSGVYEIVDGSGRRYIGSSSGIKRRWSRHKDDLKRGCHHARFMQRVANAHGLASLRFRVVVACRPSDLLMYEQLLIDAYKPEFNGSKVAGRIEHTAEVRALISRKCKAAFTPARRERQRELMKANPPPRPNFSTPEHKAKLRQVHRERTATHKAFGSLWSLKDLAETYSIHYGMLRSRVSAGWDAERAVLQPKRAGGL